MSVKLLAEHLSEVLSLKGGSTCSSESTLENATLLEITCHGSYNITESMYSLIFVASAGNYGKNSSHQILLLQTGLRVNRITVLNL